MRYCSKGSLVFLICVFIVAAILSSCLNEEAENNVVQLPSEISVFTLKEEISISDFTEFGLWSFSIPLKVLEEHIDTTSHYSLKTSNGTFELQPNIADSTRLITFLPQSIQREKIEQGVIVSFKNTRNIQSRISELSVEKVIIIGEETRNATNTYEMLLTHYIQFKDANAYLVFDSEGNLIRPAYVKNNEENAYTLKFYYDARQAASEQTPDGAFEFLKGRGNHEQLLFLGNANRVEYDATITYQEPDQRDRLRELGPVGNLSDPSNTYNLETDSIDSQTIVSIHSDRLTTPYDDATFYFTRMKDSTECHFSSSDAIAVYTAPIAFDTTQSTELIKNSRFDCSKNKIIRFDSDDQFQKGYDNINTAVSETNSGDIIRIAGGTVINNTNNTAKITEQICYDKKDLAFESLSDEMYTIDMENLATRAFLITGSTSTIKDAIIKNGALTNDIGGGIKLVSSVLHLEDSIVASNTVSANSSGYYGGGIYAGNSDLFSKNATITHNSIDEGQGGGLCFSDSADEKTMILDQCHISENSSSKNGGGMHVSGGKLAEIKNCTILDNHVSGDASDFLNGGGISAKGNVLSLSITDTIIASNSALKFGGGLLSGALSATITNTEFKNNTSQKEGAAVCFRNYATNPEAVFFSNTIIDNNSTDTQVNGVYVEDRATIFNADGTSWKQFNSPLATLSFTENTNNSLNTYSGQGTESGNDISFEQQQTTKGTLSIKPAVSEEQSATVITLDYLIGCEFHGGTLTIKVPTGFEITEDASFIIDNIATPVNVYSWTSQQLNIVNLNLESGTVTLRLKEQEIPDGLNAETVSSRDVNYTFRVIADADGSESSWRASSESTAKFLSQNKSATIDVKIKSGNNYLTLLSREATEILFDKDTAAQTTVASITQALESTDGSTQEYSIYKADGGGTVTLSDSDILPSEATLCVTALHGNSQEYRVFTGTYHFNLVKSNGEQSLYLTLSEAIGALESAETGTIYCSTSTVKESELIIDDGKIITILPTTTISGNIILDGNSSHRVLNISSNASVTLKNITVQEGSVADENGGGITVNAATLILESCLVTNNDALGSGKGGGIYNQNGGMVRCIDSTISRNSAQYGGGVAQNANGTPPTFVVISGTIQENGASVKGGGIYKPEGYVKTKFDAHWGGGFPSFKLQYDCSIADNDGSAKAYNVTLYSVHLLGNVAGDITTNQFGQ